MTNNKRLYCDLMLVSENYSSLVLRGTSGPKHFISILERHTTKPSQTLISKQKHFNKSIKIAKIMKKETVNSFLFPLEKTHGNSRRSCFK